MKLTNKAFGLDKISARLLKDSVDVITPSLTNLQINIVNYLHNNNNNIINHLYSAKIQKFSGASHSMRNIIKNILIKNIYKINENKKIDKLNKFKTNKSLGSF